MDGGRSQASCQGPASVLTTAAAAAPTGAIVHSATLVAAGTGVGAVTGGGRPHARQPPRIDGSDRRDRHVGAPEEGDQPPCGGRAVARTGSQHKYLGAEGPLANHTRPAAHRVRVDAGAHPSGAPLGTRSLPHGQSDGAAERTAPTGR